MSLRDSFATARHVGHKAAHLLAPVALLLARLVYGLAFVQTGWGKLGNLSGITTYFESLHIPLASVQAPFVALVELLGGIALVVGFGTRFAAFLLSCTMVVAILTADWLPFVNALEGHPDKDKELHNITPVHFLLTLLLLVAFGAGAISVDRILERRRSKTASS